SIEPGIVVGNLNRSVRAAGHLRTQQAEAKRAVGPEARAARAADRDADDHITHQIEHVVRAEPALVSEEARRVSEVGLEPDYAGAHRARIHAEVRHPLP